MRKIIVSEFVSLDGVMEGPGPADSFKYAGWTVPYVSDEFMKFKYDELFAGDALLLGRLTYEGFAKAWPSMKDSSGFADRMNSIPKYVVSTMLQKLEWNNATVIGPDTIGEIKKLKEAPGKDILVFGSSMLLQTLMEHNLVDEYRLLVYPVVLGTGKRLFKEGNYAILKLIETKELPKGVLYLRYTPDFS